MKGVIVKCLAEMVNQKFGKEKWDEILVNSGFKKGTVFYPTEDIDDKSIVNVINNICNSLSITLHQTFDAFGEYWMCNFAPKMYAVFFKNINNAKDFILKLDEIHSSMTRYLSNSQPPRFEFLWKNDKTLIITYKSKRGMIDLAVSLLKGVGKFYKEDLKVNKIGNDKIEVEFMK